MMKKKNKVKKPSKLEVFTYKWLEPYFERMLQHYYYFACSKFEYKDGYDSFVVEFNKYLKLKSSEYSTLLEVKEKEVKE